MRMLSIVLISTALAGCVGTRVGMRITDKTQPAHTDKVCIIQGPAPSGAKFKPIGFLDAYMHHYGGAEYLLDNMADEARKLGADGVVGVESGQEFGYFPWRIVRPRAKGHAVKFTEPIDCAQAGGQLR